MRLPEQGQDVFVIAPSGTTIGARVRDVDSLSTLLSFEGGASDPVAVLSGGHVSIQFTNRRGVCRVDGQAHREPEDGVLRVDHTGEVVLIQRREFVRVDATVRVSYTPVDGDGYSAETTTVNVSGGGFMVSGREALKVGEVISFTLQLDGDTRDAGPLEAIGRVVRDTAAGLGVEVEHIDERERERLIRWVFARERLGRQILGGS